MRIRLWFVLAVLVAVGLASTPAQASAQQLGADAASQAAQQLGTTIVDRDPKLQTFSLFACSRTSSRAFFCLVEASGETKHQRLECDLRVTVRLAGEAPTARLSHRGCHTKDLLYLTRERAATALEEAFLRLHGPTLPREGAGVGPTQRIGGAAFEGTGVWIKEVTPEVLEICEVKMRAELTGPQTINIVTEEPTCKQTYSIPG